MPDTEDLVLLASFSLPSEADVVASLLDGAGIASLLDRPFVSGVRPDWLLGNEGADSGVRVYVRKDDEERAREILAALPEPDDRNSA